ncbi:MAG: hypothetical protein JWO36_476 [Myxococcales bacterium]|nr:hypothetical protein [Myxococcales bacterium]
MRRIAVACLGTALATVAAPAFAEPLGGGISINEEVGPMIAARPRDVMHPVLVDPQNVPALVNSHVLYLNPCMPNGCKVVAGQTDSRTDHSDITQIGQATLSAYPYGAAKWAQVVACMKATMAPFNLTVTDVDPGSAPHFEVMIAGSPTQLGLPNGIGGIADYSCQSPGQCSQYIPNALVFDFTQVWGGNVNEDCSTAAQEIAHAWTLDHVVDPSDPMTYNNYSGMRTFKDARQCGSDCQNGQSPFGQTCVGQNHVCMSTGAQTQDELKIIKAIFGPAGAAAPDVKILTPAQGSAQAKGFTVEATCTSADGVQEVDMSVDGVLISSLTAAPYKFTTATDLKDGAHKISVLCASKLLATATANADVVIGQKCASDGDCPMSYLCYGSACVAGGDIPGGLGGACTSNSQCVGGSCASDGTSMYCVVPCDPANDLCPNGFGCLVAGGGGVCWPGAEKGGGGGCSTGSGGSILLGLGFAALLITRRKR